MDRELWKLSQEQRSLRLDMKPVRNKARMAGMAPTVKEPSPDIGDLLSSLRSIIRTPSGSQTPGRF